MRPASSTALLTAAAYAGGRHNSLRVSRLRSSTNRLLSKSAADRSKQPSESGMGWEEPAPSGMRFLKKTPRLQEGERFARGDVDWNMSIKKGNAPNRRTRRGDAKSMWQEADWDGFISLRFEPHATMSGRPPMMPA